MAVVALEAALGVGVVPEAFVVGAAQERLTLPPQLLREVGEVGLVLRGGVGRERRERHRRHDAYSLGRVQAGDLLLQRFRHRCTDFGGSHRSSPLRFAGSIPCTSPVSTPVVVIACFNLLVLSFVHVRITFSRFCSHLGQNHALCQEMRCVSSTSG